MLKTLIIDNLALIDHAEFEFDSGLTCFTGETGAGKSVFLSALKLLAGQRCERMSLRPGTSQGKIEGLFEFKDALLETVQAFLEDNDITPCEEGTLIVRRTFGDKQKISLNGNLVPLTTLKALGALWLEFHTPSEPQRLFQPSVQIDLLDRYCGLAEDRKHYEKLYKEYTDVRQQLQALKAQVQLSPEALAYLKNQLQAFAELELSQEAIEQLEREFKRISQKEECLQILHAIQAVFGETPGLNLSLDQLQNHLLQLASRLDTAQPLVEQLQKARIELQDIEAACEQEQNSFDLDPEQCARIQQRMQIWLDLQQRYGNSLEQVLSAKESLTQQLDNAEHGEEKIFQLQSQYELCEKNCREWACRLHKARESKIKSLEELITDCLKSLGFRNPKFEIALTIKQELDNRGLSSVVFNFASDAALPCLPLGNVASSGELSRVLLALKSVLNDVQSVPILVFDEIDANVGGEIGQKVGCLLKRLGQNAQVFCVTHLPQVASQSDHHFYVTKSVKDQIPTIQFEALKEVNARCRELARMLGNPDSASALQHAKTLLEAH
jgi:ATPase involved in DNA repair